MQRVIESTTSSAMVTVLDWQMSAVPNSALV
jgi:hypothetical protein